MGEVKWSERWSEVRGEVKMRSDVKVKVRVLRSNLCHGKWLGALDEHFSRNDRNNVSE